MINIRMRKNSMDSTPTSSTSPVESLDLAQIQQISQFRRRLGTEMSEILPYLYLGSLRDATDQEQLHKYRIKAIVGVHDMMSSHPLHEQLLLLRIKLSDCPSEDISAHFRDAIKFIHQCRMRQESVLVHCLAGVSRSATIVTAYVMTLCDLSFHQAISFVSERRPVVNPNFGFRMQLSKYRDKNLAGERNELRILFGPETWDEASANDLKIVNEKIKGLGLINGYGLGKCELI